MLSRIFTFGLCIFFIFDHQCYAEGAPEWPQIFSVKGVIEVPYAEIVEPFESWYDKTVGSSRMDYYNGTVKTYQLSKEGSYGTLYRVQPRIDEIVCFKTVGNHVVEVVPKSVLPNMTDYQLVGKELVNGVVAEKWQKTSEGTLYTMYLRWQEDSHNSGTKTIVPVRSEAKGLNHIYINFNEFSTAQPPPSVFKVENEEDCRSVVENEEDLVYEFNPIHDYVDSDTQHVESAWKSFKKEYSKEYTEDEDLKRKNIFRENKRYVTSMNRRNLNYTLTMNHLADLTEEELKPYTSCFLHHGGRRTVIPEFEDYIEDDVDDGPLPDKWDWRNRGAVTGVKDQSSCGSCWSFSSVGNIEGAHFLKTGKLVRLSEQSLVDCAWGYGNGGCQGGFQPAAFMWVKENGIPTENDYGNYLAMDSFCHINKTRKRIKISGFKIVKPMCVKCMKKALLKNGPLAVAISVTKPFQFYQNGVFDDKECVERPMSHAVLLVGYGTLDGKEYWIIKNSWSIYWGMNGYILLATEGNTCHINEMVSLVVT